MQDWGKIGEAIAQWIGDYATQNNMRQLVVGISGGIDSAVTSTLCAKTGIDTIVLHMPIHQSAAQSELAHRHINWLTANWPQVTSHSIDLTATFDTLSGALGQHGLSALALANTRARLRMATLYALAGSQRGIVVGTGNKVEDFGVGFFTKYGDGGVDISPIADLYKSEVRALATALGIAQAICTAAPTDGLWEDGRTDEDQLGATYRELEWAMEFLRAPTDAPLTDRQQAVLEIYRARRRANAHKMEPIPIFKLAAR